MVSAFSSCRGIPPGGRSSREIVAESCRRESGVLLGWRDVPTDPTLLGDSVRPHAPACVQAFFGRPEGVTDQALFERKLFILRKVISGVVHELDDARVSGFYPVSMSSQTVVYKGLLLATRLGEFYPDLRHPAFESALALVHQRFLHQHLPVLVAGPHPVSHGGRITVRSTRCAAT